MLSEIKWFPMRVTYNRELKVKEYLDSIQIENFLPFKPNHYEIDCQNKANKKEVLIHNLIFIRSSQARITMLKNSSKSLEPLRYIIDRSSNQIMVVPDKQMNDFIRVSTSEEDTMLLDYKDFLDKVGKKVRITQGYFSGVEGEIKRIKKNKYVVVKIDGLVAVALTCVPKSFLEII